jgi:hypothetical protein
MHVDDVDGRHRREIAQPLQRGSDQARPALALVEEAQFGPDLVAIRGRPRQQRLDLAVDGVPFSLLIGRDPGVDRRPDCDRRARPPWGQRVDLHHAPPLSAACAG